MVNPSQATVEIVASLPNRVPSLQLMVTTQESDHSTSLLHLGFRHQSEKTTRFAHASCAANHSPWFPLKPRSSESWPRPKPLVTLAPRPSALNWSPARIKMWRFLPLSPLSQRQRSFLHRAD